MATAKNTRAAKALSVNAPGVLRDISHHLKTVMAVAYTVSVAMKHQNADGDVNAALTLQRCVGDELDRQIGRIETLIAGGVS
jgi:hypothetical protein